MCSCVIRMMVQLYEKGEEWGLKIKRTVDCVRFRHCSHCFFSLFLLSYLVSHCLPPLLCLFAFFCFFGEEEVGGSSPSKQGRVRAC